MRVQLQLPEEARNQGAEYGNYHGCKGVVVAGAGKEGVWVQFDGQAQNDYVGCPLKYLRGIPDTETLGVPDS